MGVIHRDLKPPNMMRDPAGRVLVMDFGLAHHAEGTGLTQTGVVLGTLDICLLNRGKGWSSALHRTSTLPGSSFMNC